MKVKDPPPDEEAIAVKPVAVGVDQIISSSITERVIDYS